MDKLLNGLSCPAAVKSMKTEPGEVTSPPHSSNKKDEGLKRDRESQEMNDSDEDDDDEDDDEEEGDLLEEEGVRQGCKSRFDMSSLFFPNTKSALRNTCSSFGCYYTVDNYI